jgi:hypothetical protein
MTQNYLNELSQTIIGAAIESMELFVKLSKGYYWGTIVSTVVDIRPDGKSRPCFEPSNPGDSILKIPTSPILIDYRKCSLCYMSHSFGFILSGSPETMPDLRSKSRNMAGKPLVCLNLALSF